MIGLTDDLGRTTTFALSNRDWITSITGPDPQGEQEAPVTQFGSDLAGRRTSVTDPLDRVTLNEFDAEGRLVEITGEDPDDTGPRAAPIFAFAYNAVGLLVSETEPRGKCHHLQIIDAKDGTVRGSKLTFRF